MKSLSRIAYGIFLLAFSAAPLRAASDVGTTAAPFLKIGAGARPAGMGEAFTAVADDVNAVAWNPAGLGRLTSPQFTAMHSQWFQSADYEFVAAAYPTRFGVLGLGMSSFNIDKIERRAADTLEADGVFDSQDDHYTLSYGKSLTENWAFGLTAGLLRLKLDAYSASGMTMDLGALWRTPHRPLTVGLAVRHLGSEVKFDEESDPLPMTTTLGLGYKPGGRLTLAVDLKQPRDNDLQVGLGGEFAQPITKDISGALRAGYTSSGQDVSEGLTGVSMGLGLTWRSVGFDAAWVPYGLLGNTFRYAFLIKF